MRRARMKRHEIDAAVRAAGVRSLMDVESVVLETAGSFSVVESREPRPAGADEARATG